MRRPLFAACLCVVIVLTLWSTMRDCLPEKQARSGEPDSGELVTVTGQVYQKTNDSITIKKVSYYPDKDSYYSENQNAVSSQQEIKCKYHIICSAESEEEFENVPMGSYVAVRGKYYDYTEAANPGEFNADSYYRSIGICGRLTRAKVVADSGKYSHLSETLYRLRERWKNRLYQIFPEKEASIMATMLLGEKKELDQDIKDLYTRNGIVHILSISGLHISILGMGIYRFLRRVGLPAWLAALLGSSALVLYGILTGLSVSAMRAIGMYLYRMLAEAVGRTYDMLTALGVMAAALLFANPSYIHNAGFLLSFGAVLGIAVVSPVLAPHVKGLRASLCGGFAVGLVTLPIQLWYYYEVPVYSMFINLLILPFMSVMMILGFLVMLIPGTGFLGTVNMIILCWYEKVCHWFERLPMRIWNPGKPKAWQMWLYCGILLLVLFLGRRARKREADSAEKSDKRRSLRRSIWLLCIMDVFILCVKLPSGNQVTFLDVGQGDGIVLETASGEVYLIDCGSSSRDQVGEYVLLPYLKYRGIKKIDAVLLSHADFDHYGGIVELLQCASQEGITIGQVVLPAIHTKMRKEEFAPILEAVEYAEQLSKKKIPVGYLKAQDAWETKGVSFLCLHPAAGSGEGGNASSECIYVTFGTGDEKCSFLFTGDVEENGERELIEALQRQKIQDITVLKVAHHGSHYSTTEEFLHQIDARIAVISCGKNNRYGHPHEELLERLQKEGSMILRTDESGALIFSMKKKKIEVRKWKNP